MHTIEQLQSGIQDLLKMGMTKSEIADFLFGHYDLKVIKYLLS